MSRHRRGRGAALKIWGPVVAVVVGGFFFAAKFVEPAAPRKIQIAAGSRTGAYYHFAERYKEELDRVGVEVEVLETRGSLDNCARIRAGDGSVIGFAQGGTVSPEKWPEIEVLASLYLEPLWVFYRRDRFEGGTGAGDGRLTVLGQLRGKTVAVGPEGSGTRAVALELLGRNGVSPKNSTFSARPSAEAATKLRDGAIDAIFVVASPHSKVVRELLEAPMLRLMSFKRHLAYTRQLDYLRPVEIAEGMMDLAHGIPEEPVTLLAPTAALVARRGDPPAGVHPAIVEVLLRAAHRLHGRGDLLSEPGTFPSAKWGRGVPLDPTAERILTSGASFLSRVLPFWALNLLRRFKVLLLPLLTLLLPLIKIAPAIFRWRMNARIFRWYRVLEAVEDEFEAHPESARRLREAIASLQALDKEAAAVTVPATFMKDVYNLRVHIRLVRSDVEELLQALPQETTDVV